LFLISSTKIFAQSEVGPDGDKLLIILFVIAILVLGFWVLNRFGKKRNGKTKRPLFPFRKIQVNLEKDRMYHPNILTLTVKNTGNIDLDLNKPLLIFDNLLTKRKFKIKGSDNHTFYPLYLEKGKTHTLEINLNRLYIHDKSLKRFPKVKIIIFDLKGRQMGNKSIFLRKTLLKF
jgi:hypothetical protein